MKYDHQNELIKQYIEYAAEFINEFDGLLLQLERMLGQEPDIGLLNDILGLLHTFKGNSGMMGFFSLQKYVHKLEDLFKALQESTLKSDATLAEFCLQSASVLRNAFSKISPENPTDYPIGNDIEILEKFIAGRIKAASSSSEVSLVAAKESANSFIHKTNVLKVDFKRLDHLLNLMGELVIYRTRLGRVEAQFREAFGEKGLSLDLSHTAEQIGKVTTELHEAIMNVRLLPIKQVFLRFPRMVRDLAHERGKDVSIRFEGEETELDKTVIDEIGEPLMHLIRNAVDHGIEQPQMRAALGKPRQGTILVRIYQESSHIIIVVQDDGKGIDEKRLQDKAERAGLLKEENEGRNLLEFIFLSGMSTAEEVTEVSGRGVGLDVVKKSLAKINGSIEVESEIHVGTRFTIKLPLTLAIVPVLMVKVSEEQYAIPLAVVVESVKVENADIHLVNNREVAKIRDRILPLARLSELFGLSCTGNGETNYMVIVQSTTGKMGLVVDSLLGQHEIVIKSLDDYLGDSEGIAGATILGDGKVVLIIDILELTGKINRHEAYEKETEVQYA